MQQRTAARLAWSVWAVSMAATVTALMLLFLSRNTPVPRSFGPRGFPALFALAFGTVGALVTARRHENPLGWIFLIVGALSAVQVFGEEYGIYGQVVHHGYPGALFLGWLQSWIWVPIVGTIMLFAFPLFPTGRLPGPGWRVIFYLAPVAIALYALPSALTAGPMDNMAYRSNPYAVASAQDALTIAAAVGGILLIGCALASIASLVRRFRRAIGDERQQMKWFALAASFVGIAIAATSIGNISPQTASIPRPLALFVIVSFFSVPIAMGVAILKYRLYDIDLVISRTLVYGALAAFIGVVYVAVVVGIGAAIGTSGKPNIGLSIAATAIVAVAFQPLRERLQRLANRLVYGERATPYEVLSGFSERVAEAYATEEVLPRMAQVVAEATGAARTAVWLRVGEALRLAASWPEGSDGPSLIPLTGGALPPIDGADRAVEVRHRGELLGALSLSKRTGEPVTPAEDALLADLASQAGLVLRNAGLTAELSLRLEELTRQAAELRASRQRIVAAQDAERRRLERNIHDGAQQHLVALAVKLNLAKALATRDAEKARGLLIELQAQTTEALETLRDLSRGIYPPALVDRGIAAALAAQARSMPLAVEVEDAGVGRLSPEAEGAVYFCIMEALQNAAKYSGADRVTVRLALGDGSLDFAVADRGAGFDPQTAARGSGLQNMTDRVSALGGSVEVRSAPGKGTTVEGRIPVPAMEPAR